MSEPAISDILAFNNNGGLGVTVAVSDVAASGLVPGSGSDAGNICITNEGDSVAHVAIGQAGIVATLNHQSVLPGTQTVWGLPYVNQNPLWVSAICASGKTTILNFTRGRGT